MVTLQRLKYRALISDRIALQLAQLPTAEDKNGMIIAVMLGPLDSNVEVLGFCDLLEDVVDSGASKKFIHNLRAGMNFVEFKLIVFPVWFNYIYKVNKYQINGMYYSVRTLCTYLQASSCELARKA